MVFPRFRFFGVVTVAAILTALVAPGRVGADDVLAGRPQGSGVDHVTEMAESPFVSYSEPVDPKQYEALWPHMMETARRHAELAGAVPEDLDPAASELAARAQKMLFDERFVSWAASAGNGPILPEHVPLAVREWAEELDELLREDVAALKAIASEPGEDLARESVSFDRLFEAVAYGGPQRLNGDLWERDEQVTILVDVALLRFAESSGLVMSPALVHEFPPRVLLLLRLGLLGGRPTPPVPPEEKDPNSLPGAQSRRVVKGLDLTGRVMTVDAEGDCGGTRHSGPAAVNMTPVSEAQCDRFKLLASSQGLPASLLSDGVGPQRQRLTAIPATVLVTAYWSVDGLVPTNPASSRILYQAAVSTDENGFFRHRLQVPSVPTTYSRIFVRTDVYLQGQVLDQATRLLLGDSFVRSFAPNSNTRYLGNDVLPADAQPIGNLLSQAEQARLLPGGAALVHTNTTTGRNEFLHGYFGSVMEVGFSDPAYTAVPVGGTVGIATLPLLGPSTYGHHRPDATSFDPARVRRCAFATDPLRSTGTGDCGRSWPTQDRPGVPVGARHDALEPYAGVVRSVRSFTDVVLREAPGQRGSFYLNLLFPVSDGEDRNRGPRGLHVVHDLTAPGPGSQSNPIPAHTTAPAHNTARNIHLVNIPTLSLADQTDRSVYPQLSGTMAELVGRLVIEGAGGTAGGGEPRLQSSAPDVGYFGWVGFMGAGNSGLPENPRDSQIMQFDRTFYADFNHTFRVGAGIALGSMLRRGSGCDIPVSYRLAALPHMYRAGHFGTVNANPLQWRPGVPSPNSNGILSWIATRRELQPIGTPPALERIAAANRLAELQTEIHAAMNFESAPVAELGAANPLRYATLLCDLLDDVVEPPLFAAFDGRITSGVYDVQHVALTGIVPPRDYTTWYERTRWLFSQRAGEPAPDSMQQAVAASWRRDLTVTWGVTGGESTALPLVDLLRAAAPNLQPSYWNVAFYSREWPQRYLDEGCAPMAPSRLLDRLGVPLVQVRPLMASALMPVRGETCGWPGREPVLIPGSTPF